MSAISSDVDLCNQALSAIGTQSQIQSLTENSTEALECSIHYATLRNSLLRDYRWGFARKEAPLSVLKAAQGTPENPTGTTLPLPPVGWRYEYAYPTDCLQLRMIIPNALASVGLSPALFTGQTGGPFQRGARGVRYAVAQDQDANGNPIIVILCNETQAIGIYTVETTNPTLFDPDFVVALVGRLAAKLVSPLSGDKGLAQLAIREGLRVEDIASARNANENPVIMSHIPDFIRARGFIGFDTGWDDFS